MHHTEPRLYVHPIRQVFFLIPQETIISQDPSHDNRFESLASALTEGGQQILLHVSLPGSYAPLLRLTGGIYQDRTMLLDINTPLLELYW